MQIVTKKKNDKYYKFYVQSKNTVGLLSATCSSAKSPSSGTAARIISSCILLVDVGFADAIGLQTHSILVSQTSVIRGQLADY